MEFLMNFLAISRTNCPGISQEIVLILGRSIILVSEYGIDLECVFGEWKQFCKSGKKSP